MIQEQKEELQKGKCFVYVDTVADAKDLAADLKAEGISAEFVVGVNKMTPLQRDAAVSKWEAGEAKVLIGTDAMGVGINQDVRRVIILGLPQDLENYWQKVGRLARKPDTQGVAILYWSLGDLQSIGYKVKNAMPQLQE